MCTFIKRMLFIEVVGFNCVYIFFERKGLELQTNVLHVILPKVCPLVPHSDVLMLYEFWQNDVYFLHRVTFPKLIF